MPTISWFYGILIQMYYDDHSPPHFHAVYGEYKAVISICDHRLLGGDLPPRALSLVTEWTKQHKERLLEDWRRASEKQILFLACATGVG